MVAKTSTKHPYAAIEHRVMDSPAYADLKHSSRSLLLLIARQLSKDNNGHLQASFTWCKRFGFGSEHTLRDAIAELIAHGFIYRTRSHGANKAWAKYAVTWLSLSTDRKGLFVSGFKPCAWRDWQSVDRKISRQKVQDQSGRKCSFTPDNPAESAGRWGAINAGYELMPCSSAVSAQSAKPERNGKLAMVYRLIPVNRTRFQPIRSAGRTGIGATTSPKRTETAFLAAQTPDLANDYQRIREGDQDAAQWDGELGDFVQPTPKESRTILHRRSA